MSEADQRGTAITHNHSTQQVSEQIADQLGETHLIARKKIEQIIEACGIEQALAWLEETLAIETGGGLMVSNGERRRTPGGVFFYLVKGRLAKELRKELFPSRPKKRKQKSGQADQESATHDDVVEPMAVSENLGRLEELRKAEQETLERLAAIQALPPSERAGLMSVMKDLQRIREELKSLPDNLSPD